MYSEKRIESILDEFKIQRINLNIKISEPELKEKYWTEYILINEKIILLETILEKSEWQKLMRQDSKKNIFRRAWSWMNIY